MMEERIATFTQTISGKAVWALFAKQSIGEIVTDVLILVQKETVQIAGPDV